MARTLAALVLLVLTGWPAQGQQPQTAGTVNRLSGTATATRGDIVVALDAGTVVLVGDRISTGDDTRLRLLLTSGATIVLGDNSSVTVEAHEPAAGGLSVLELIHGVFLAVTAAVKDTPPPDDAMIIRTPNAVLGIRGTEVLAEQQPDHLGVLMLSGTAVAVTAPEGTVTLSGPLLGTDVRTGNPPTPPKRWGQKRVDAAHRSVAFE